ncbi:helix-hairpin-helix domain-containing protein [Streptomyces sp. NPDC048751]|uniref:helix-hairpin-helix domain-containing protein n=1 Tax=Streptomyces sp. NPDC048751 TaxID=3365591 RepID=UPI0037198A03
MALRSRSRTATATSGPGRGATSDVRTRHLRRRSRTPQDAARHRHASSAEELRRRAEMLFAPGEGQRGESGSGPPGEGRGGVLVGAGAAAGVGAGTDVGAGAGPEVGEGFDGPSDRAEVVGAADAGARDAGSRWPGGAENSAEAPRARARVRVGLALRERMPVWLQARCGLELRSVLALTALLVVAAAFAVQHFWTGRPQPVQAPEVVRAAAPYEARESGRAEAEPDGASAGAPTATATGTAGAEIVVDVSGKVRDPGIHRLPAGSRVADALRAAGGVRPGTNTDGLNRARFLVDGEQVLVGGSAAAPGVAPGPGGAGPAGGAPGGAAPATPVSLNTATVDQLDTLPGVGPVLAQHIVDYRTRNGGFRSIDELREVNGIGERRFADLRNLVRP